MAFSYKIELLFIFAYIGMGCALYSGMIKKTEPQKPATIYNPPRLMMRLIGIEVGAIIGLVVAYLINNRASGLLAIACGFVALVSAVICLVGWPELTINYGSRQNLPKMNDSELTD